METEHIRIQYFDGKNINLFIHECQFLNYDERDKRVTYFLELTPNLKDIFYCIKIILVRN